MKLQVTKNIPSDPRDPKCSCSLAQHFSGEVVMSDCVVGRVLEYYTVAEQYFSVMYASISWLAGHLQYSTDIAKEI
jgi:hypothetical protein